MTYIGSVTFSVLLVTLFQPLNAPPTASPGFWKKSSSAQTVRHRGFSANSTARTNLQIGENKVQSFLAASSLGASCVEFDLQLTKDCFPVIFHDFLVMETGGDVPLHMLTFDQFMHLSRCQAPRGDLLSSAEVIYLERNKVNGILRSKQRSHLVNTYDDYRSQDLVERMRFTKEGMRNNIKGKSQWSLDPRTLLNFGAAPHSITRIHRLQPQDKVPHALGSPRPRCGIPRNGAQFFVDTIPSTIFRL